MFQVAAEVLWEQIEWQKERICLDVDEDSSSFLEVFAKDFWIGPLIKRMVGVRQQLRWLALAVWLKTTRDLHYAYEYPLFW